MTNLLYSAKHYQTKCAEALDSVINYANIASELLNDAKNIAKSATFGNIGDIKYTIRKDVPNGGFWCDGSLIQQNDLPTIYDMLLQQKLYSIDINTYNNVVNLNGSCGFFGLDTVNKSFKLPLLQDIYIKTGQVADEFGAESLPNITGTFDAEELTNSKSGSVSTTGALYAYDSKKTYQATGATPSGAALGIDASRSSPTYQDGAKVNPDHVKYRAYIILFSGEKELSIVNWTNSLQKTTEDGIKLIDQKANSYLDKTQITNCITEIPQDIKLELNNDTLTVKYDSKVWIPYGTTQAYKVGDIDAYGHKVVGVSLIGGRFFYAIKLENNLSVSILWAVSGIAYVFYDIENKTLYNQAPNYSNSNLWSGASPTIDKQYGVWYNTSSNIIQKTRDTGTTWTNKYSLPICIVSTNENKNPISINQIFNGFGYISSIIFTLPGIKGLIPSGRNSDGSLKNIEFVSDNVFIADINAWGTQTDGKLIFSDTFTGGTTVTLYFQNQARFQGSNVYLYEYKEDENLWYFSSDSGNTWTARRVMILSDNVDLTNGIVTTLDHKLPFRAISQEDLNINTISRNMIPNWQTPGTLYNAGTALPEDGFVYVIAIQSNTYVNGHQIGIMTTSGGSGWTSPNANTSFYARKGDVITGVNYYFKPLGEK